MLSRGESITVVHTGRKENQATIEMKEIPKTLFPLHAWDDYWNSRQLIENYDSLHLSRLELVKIALDCLMSRKFREEHSGDRVYALMGLLRVRPTIDGTDSSFQAFGRYVLPIEGFIQHKKLRFKGEMTDTHL